MTDEAIIQKIVLIIFPLGILMEFISLCFILFLKKKWLLLVEDILEEGRRFYSLNIFLSGMGTLHYATIFFNKFQAKRYGLLDKREQVPKPVQRLFIFTFCLFMMSGVLMFGSALVVYSFKT
jgi:hypothetical protein